MDQSRWDSLFDDLEAQLAAEAQRELEGEVADRTRRERALVSWQDRLAGQGDEPIGLVLDGGLRLTGRVISQGGDWLLVDEGPEAREVLMRLDAVLSVTGLRTRASGAVTARRFGLGSALRVLARDRAHVEVIDRSGGTRTGTLDVVHADAVEMGQHDLADAGRPRDVVARVVVPFAAISAVRRR